MPKTNAVRQKEWRLRHGAKTRCREARKYVELIKAFSSCECGESHPSTLDFHHKNPMQKSKTISSIANLAELKIELEKCIVLCANCHRKHHYIEERIKRIARAFLAFDPCI